MPRRLIYNASTEAEKLIHNHMQWSSSRNDWNILFKLYQTEPDSNSTLNIQAFIQNRLMKTYTGTYYKDTLTQTSIAVPRVHILLYITLIAPIHRVKHTSYTYPTSYLHI